MTKGIRSARWAGGPGRSGGVGAQLPKAQRHPPRTAYTEGMGWRVMRGPDTVASGFDTREEAQAHLEGLTKWGLAE